ncbi:hypothetical protein [Streptomyces sp. HPF1205]|uniref:hypothetical protein n=1 Tax=Streptomyces sp. HPF1205 TaxID=2873262 RepID=UPI001CED1CF4|nr:hypothetical protein [Streptomyces sp. HPF1205]
MSRVVRPVGRRARTAEPAARRTALANHDRLPVGTVGHRIRSPAADEPETLPACEHEHADRAPVTRVPDERLARVRSGSEPSPGGDASPPRRPTPTGGGSEIALASPPEPMGPPPHGAPARPARPKADRPR